MPDRGLNFWEVGFILVDLELFPTGSKLFTRPSDHMSRQCKRESLIEFKKIASTSRTVPSPVWFKQCWNGRSRLNLVINVNHIPIPADLMSQISVVRKILDISVSVRKTKIQLGMDPATFSAMAAGKNKPGMPWNPQCHGWLIFAYIGHAKNAFHALTKVFKNTVV